MSKSFQPDEENDIDREIRIEKMKRELDDLAGGSAIYGGRDDVPPKMEEAFLEHVLRFEHAKVDTTFNRLAARGFILVPSTELDDATLSAKLGDLLRELASMRCFVEQTDHLSDRELYTWLWTEGLRNETPDPVELDSNWHTSPIGGCSEEDTEIYLKYYASEEDRRHWHEQFPDDPLPSHEPPPHDRDKNLPRATNLG